MSRSVVTPSLDNTPDQSIVHSTLEYEVVAMNDTDYVALVDTTRDELRERITQARQRFDRLVRTAGPARSTPQARVGQFSRWPPTS